MPEGPCMPCLGQRGAWLFSFEWAQGCGVEKVVQCLSVPG